MLPLTVTDNSEIWISGKLIRQSTGEPFSDLSQNGPLRLVVFFALIVNFAGMVRFLKSIWTGKK